MNKSKNLLTTLISISLGTLTLSVRATAAVLGPVDLGDLTNFVVFGQQPSDFQYNNSQITGDIAIADGKINWSGGQTIFGDVIYEADVTNGDQAQDFLATGFTATEVPNGGLSNLTNNLASAFSQIDALTNNFTFNNLLEVDGFNSQNNMADVNIIQIEGGQDIKDVLNIFGDSNDIFIFRYNSGVEQKVSGGCINLNGGLTTSSVIFALDKVVTSGGSNDCQNTNPALLQGAVLSGTWLVKEEASIVSGFINGALYAQDQLKIVSNSGADYQPYEPEEGPVEIPEPSTLIGTIITLALGAFGFLKKKRII